MTISGLTTGVGYQFQFWCENPTTDVGQFTATAGNAVTLSSNPSGASGGAGQFALGTFTADSSLETITFAATDTFAHLNGAQLRQISTPAPEPGPTTLAALTAAALCALRRRRDPGQSRK